MRGFHRIIFKADLRRRNLDLKTKFAIIAALAIMISPAYVYATSGATSVDVDGTSWIIEYEVDGVEVNSVQSDLDFVSLIFNVDVTGSPGILEISFDRNFFDSIYAGSDDDFIIIADGDEPIFEETTTDKTRTLSIELPTGTDEVEIIGTQFGVQSTIEEEVMEEEVMEEEVTEEETMMEEESTTQCGPGTMLKDGVCVLDQKCGPGTILEGDVCVLSQSAPSISKGSTFDLIYGAIAGLIIAFIVMTILGIISKASRQN